MPNASLGSAIAKPRTSLSLRCARVRIISFGKPSSPGSLYLLVASSNNKSCAISRVANNSSPLTINTPTSSSPRLGIALFSRWLCQSSITLPFLSLIRGSYRPLPCFPISLSFTAVGTVIATSPIAWWIIIDFRRVCCVHVGCEAQATRTSPLKSSRRSLVWRTAWPVPFASSWTTNSTSYLSANAFSINSLLSGLTIIIGFSTRTPTLRKAKILFNTINREGVPLISTKFLSWVIFSLSASGHACLCCHLLPLPAASMTGFTALVDLNCDVSSIPNISQARDIILPSFFL